jgi:hypothetical protein
MAEVVVAMRPVAVEVAVTRAEAEATPVAEAVDTRADAAKHGTDSDLQLM